MIKVPLAFFLFQKITILTKRCGALGQCIRANIAPINIYSIQLCTNSTKRQKNSSKTCLTEAKLKVLDKRKQTQKETTKTEALFKRYGHRKFKFESTRNSNLKTLNY